MTVAKMGYIIILAVMIWGCAHTAGTVSQTKQPGAAPTPDLQYPAGKTVKVLRVPLGETFTITLPSNPTTGYRWQLAQPLDKRIVSEAGHEYQPDKPARIGSGGQEVWTFRASGMGRTVISMQYIRPWETGKPPVNSGIFTVIVLGGNGIDRKEKP
jgi:inhibitor of cysteine peptidase